MYSFNPDEGSLVSSLVAWLKHLAMHRRAPESDRDDCVQEAFLSLEEAHPDWSLDDPRTRAWLAGVVRNKILDLHRHSQRSPVALLGDLAFVLSAEPSQVLEEDDPGNPRAGVRFMLQQAINTLPPDNREIVIQHVVCDLSYREIGEPLGLTADQVKWRYYRAVKTLQHLLESTSNELEQHDCVDDVLGGGDG